MPITGAATGGTGTTGAGGTGATAAGAAGTKAGAGIAAITGGTTGTKAAGAGATAGALRKMLMNERKKSPTNDMVTEFQSPKPCVFLATADYDSLCRHSTRPNTAKRGFSVRFNHSCKDGAGHSVHFRFPWSSDILDGNGLENFMAVNESRTQSRA